MLGIVGSISAIWARLIVDAHVRGCTLDVALDQECWDRAVRIYFGKEPMPAAVVG